jgi:hypothetical protein
LDTSAYFCPGGGSDLKPTHSPPLDCAPHCCVPAFPSAAYSERSERKCGTHDFHETCPDACLQSRGQTRSAILLCRQVCITDHCLVTVLPPGRHTIIPVRLPLFLLFDPAKNNKSCNTFQIPSCTVACINIIMYHLVLLPVLSSSYTI